MKRIGTITFHASYNYGSCLQAYALQEYIKKICQENCEYKIINLRTNIQKDLYKNLFQKKGIKNLLNKIIYITAKKDFEKKDEKFEKFITEKLNITKEYNSLKEIEESKLNFDYYISGSDQLWNLNALDFDWANYLEFVYKGKKISYAASFGPKVQSWSNDEKKRIKEDLLKYDYISVREQGSFNNVKKLTGLEPEINVDPTMLLTKAEWEDIIPDKPIINNDYILLYNLKGDKEILKIAKEVSKKLKLPIIVTKKGFNVELIYGFKKKYDVGPIEFLNLLKNAKLVLSSSFHGTVFSIIFNKPFFAINGAKDFRIHTLLEKMNLKDRTIEIDNIEEKCKKAYNISFDESLKLLEAERLRSEKYLKKALDIE